MADLKELTVGIRVIRCDECGRAEVVRCHECEYWMYEYDDVGLCVIDVPDIDGVQRFDHDFCSYGERKDA